MKNPGNALGGTQPCRLGERHIGFWMTLLGDCGAWILDFFIVSKWGRGGPLAIRESWIPDSCGVLSVNKGTRLGVMAHAVNPSTREAEATESL